MMALRWDDSHDGSPAELGYDGARLDAQVAFYDVVDGGGRGWVGYHHGHRVTGRYPNSATSRREVERTVMPCA